MPVLGGGGRPSEGETDLGPVVTDTGGGEPWWKTAVVYQVYPRSFADSDGDGVGDLEGVRRRLDHLAWLGVDAVWLSPFYRSPMADAGYDISDYCDVDPAFGTLDDFDRLDGDWEVELTSAGTGGGGCFGGEVDGDTALLLRRLGDVPHRSDRQFATRRRLSGKRD